MSISPVATGLYEIEIRNWAQARHLLPAPPPGVSRMWGADGRIAGMTNDPDEYAWIVEDDSMEGDMGFPWGSILVFSPRLKPSQGDIVMVDIDHRPLPLVREVVFCGHDIVLIPRSKRGPYNVKTFRRTRVTAIATAVGMLRQVGHRGSTKD